MSNNNQKGDMGKSESREDRKKRFKLPRPVGKKDNVVYVETSDETREHNNQRAKRTQNNKKTKFLLFLLVVAVVFAVFMYFHTKEYQGYKILSVTETNYENTANYMEFAEGLLRYSPDGVSYINSNGDTVWSAGINMKMPIAATCDKYAVVADISGNTVCVFDTSGQVSSLTMPYNVCDVDVASQGAFAVVLESDKTNYVNMYKKNGDIICEMQTTINKSGYPLDITLSDNGEKLFTSYLNVQGVNVTNSLAAYNFGNVGQNTNADRIVGGYSFDDQIFPKVEFINSDTVVAYGTKNICIYSMKEKPSEITKISCEREIKSVFYNEKYFGVVEANENDAGAPYEMVVYTAKGRKIFAKKINFEYENIYAAEDEIIITGGTECSIIRRDGSVKFDGEFDNPIVSMVPSGKKLQYIVVYANETDLIKLKSDIGVAKNSDEVKQSDEDVATMMDSTKINISSTEATTEEAEMEQTTTTDTSSDTTSDTTADTTTDTTADTAADTTADTTAAQ